MSHTIWQQTIFFSTDELRISQLGSEQRCVRRADHFILVHVKGAEPVDYRLVARPRLRRLDSNATSAFESARLSFYPFLLLTSYFIESACC